MRSPASRFVVRHAPVQVKYHINLVSILLQRRHAHLCVFVCVCVLILSHFGRRRCGFVTAPCLSSCRRGRARYALAAAKSWCTSTTSPSESRPLAVFGRTGGPNRRPLMSRVAVALTQRRCVLLHWQNRHEGCQGDFDRVFPEMAEAQQSLHLAGHRQTACRRCNPDPAPHDGGQCHGAARR